MKCSAGTLSSIKESDAANELDFSNGTIGLERLFRRISEIPPGEARTLVASTFKRAMDSIYPVIKKDLGGEYVNKWFESVFSDLFKRHSDVLFKYDIPDAIPEDIAVPDRYRLFMRSHSYLIKEDNPVQYFRLLVELDKSGFQTLVFTRTPPDHLREKYRLDLPMIWLTHMPGEHRIEPTNITRLSVTAVDFLKKDVDGVIFLDGFAYLVSQNGFEAALRFIESIKDHVAMSRFRLLVPIDVQTLSVTQLHHLQRELEIIEADVIRKAFA
ncbi:Na+/solute symporter [groundwater metagenome]